jgi:hypothetical protein
VHAGPGLLYSADWRPGIHLLTGLTWMPVYRVGIGASVLVPISSARLSAPEGSVDLFASLYRLSAVWELTERTSPVSVRLDASAALAALHLVGNAAPTFRGVTDDRYVAAPSLGAMMRWFVAPSLSLFSSVTGTATFPKTIVRLAGREVTVWGRPALSAALGLEVSWEASQR